MTYSVYIDHPNGDYEFLPGEKTGDDVVSRKIGVKAKFVCNSIAKISKGDVYEIVLDSPEDASAFILACDYKLISHNEIEKYRQRKANEFAFLAVQYPLR